MLPAEVFVDAVSFLGYCDLGGLKLANKQLSAVANRCAGTIRLFDFSDLSFYIFDSYILIYRIRSAWICRLDLGSEENLVEFVREALRNCKIGVILLERRRKLVLNAVKEVADTVILGKLVVAVSFFDSMQECLGFVDSFRRMEVCTGPTQRGRQ